MKVIECCFVDYFCVFCCYLLLCDYCLIVCLVLELGLLEVIGIDVLVVVLIECVGGWWVLLLIDEIDLFLCYEV